MGLFISTTSPTADYKDSLLEKAITNMAIKLARLRSYGLLPEEALLDVNFLVTGKYEKPSFTGMRMGNFNQEHKILHFERAVPAEMLNSNRAEEFVQAVLQDVIDNAADYFHEYKLEFDPARWSRVLNS